MARSWTLAVVLAAMLAFAAAPACADFGPAPGSRFELSNLQAGAHADLTTTFSIDTNADGDPAGALRDVRVSLPRGFWATPPAYPACSRIEAAVGSTCPSSAQVGKLELRLKIPGSNSYLDIFPGPVYNVTHGPDVAAEFAAPVSMLNAYLKVRVRSSDYGLDTVSLSLTSTALVISRIRVTLWGVPADASHNLERGTCLRTVMDPTDSCPANAQRRPFMTNPASCDAPLVGQFSMDSWESPGDWITADAPIVPAGAPDGAPAATLTGCDHQPLIKPQLTAGPVGTAADSPSGYNVDVGIPQSDNPDGIATPTIKKLSVAFPEGVTISPAAADGLQACTDEQLAAGTDVAPSCPDASKVGTVSIATPTLADPLEGGMYVGQPTEGHPYRLFLVAKGSGVVLKLRGDATPDPNTGQITTTFNDTPELPFSELHVHLKSGSRALLSNPPGCGTYTSKVTVTPYTGGADETATSDFTISSDGQGGACASPTAFAPSLSAGVTNPLAGVSSPFMFRLTRADGQRMLGSIKSVHLPAGLIADVRRVPLCSDAAAAAATCPESTRVGSVQVGSGAGDHPLYLPGTVYLTGPYKGAPFGLSIVVRALAGPYDLGTVNVRAAVRVNPDASLSVEADPLPTILQGVQLRLRDIALSFDRPGFMLNPTSCAPTSITASAVSVDGMAAALSDRFQVGGCGDLGYKPKLSLALGGREKSGVTSLTAHIKTRPGDANSKRIQVELPTGVGLNVNNGAGLCSSAQFDARSCPANSIVGHASVDSILHQPLSGPVYFVQGKPAGKGGSPLPRLYIPLTGEGVTIDLVAQTTIDGGRIVTTFDPIPDVPFSTFDMKIDGGANGILAMAKEACASGLKASVQMDGYNGKLSDSEPSVPANCPLRVVSKRLSKTSFTLKVSGVGPGVLRVSGPGIRTARRTIASAAVASISARRSSSSLPGRVTVTFDPAGPAKARSITVAGAAAK